MQCRADNTSLLTCLSSSLTISLHPGWGGPHDSSGRIQALSGLVLTGLSPPQPAFWGLVSLACFGLDTVESCIAPTLFQPDRASPNWPGPRVRSISGCPQSCKHPRRRFLLGGATRSWAWLRHWHQCSSAQPLRHRRPRRGGRRRRPGGQGAERRRQPRPPPATNVMVGENSTPPPT